MNVAPFFRHCRLAAYTRSFRSIKDNATLLMASWSFCGSFAVFLPFGLVRQPASCTLKQAKPVRGCWLKSSTLSSLTLSSNDQTPLLQVSMVLLCGRCCILQDGSQLQLLISTRRSTCKDGPSCSATCSCAACFRLRRPALRGCLLAARQKETAHRFVPSRLCESASSFCRVSHHKGVWQVVRKFCFKFESEDGGQQCQRVLQVLCVLCFHLRLSTAFLLSTYNCVHTQVLHGAASLPQPTGAAAAPGTQAAAAPAVPIQTQPAAPTQTAGPEPHAAQHAGRACCAAQAHAEPSYARAEAPAGSGAQAGGLAAASITAILQDPVFEAYVDRVEGLWHELTAGAALSPEQRNAALVQAAIAASAVT